jgi:hypothetical protein
MRPVRPNILFCDRDVAPEHHIPVTERVRL